LLTVNRGQFNLILPSAAILITLVTLFFAKGGWINAWSGDNLRYVLSLFIAFMLISLITFKFNVITRRLVLIAIPLLYLIVGSGAGGVVATSFFFFSAYALGRVFLSPIAKNGIGFLESVMCGLGLYILLFYFLIKTSFNYQFSYIAILLFPCLIYFFSAGLRVADINALVSFKADFIKSLQTVDYSKLFVILFLVAFVGSYCFIPTVNYDESVFRISVWSQLQTIHTHVSDPHSQVWSVVPSSIELIHGIISLVAGSDARAGINLFFICLSTLAVLVLSGVLISDLGDRLLIGCLFLSTPLVVGLTLSLNADFMLGLLLIASCIILNSLSTNVSLTRIVALLMASAIAGTLRSPGLLMAAGLSVSLLIVMFTNRVFLSNLKKFDWCFFALAFCLIAVVGLYPFVREYHITGNPFFPMFNGYFKSTFFAPENFSDNRWVHGVSLSSYYGLFFNTSSFYESKDYVGGFQYFLLFPLSLSLIWIYKSRGLLLSLIPLLFYIVPSFLASQYLRYFFAAMPLVSVYFALFLSGNSVSSWWIKLARLGLWGFILLNFVFILGVNWLFQSSPTSVYTEEQKIKYTDRVIPEQKLNRLVNEVNPKAKVLLDFGRPFGATLAGTPIYNSWYSYTNSNIISQWKSPEDITRSIVSWGLDYAYWDWSHAYSPSETLRNLLGSYLAEFGVPRLSVGSVQALSVAKTPVVYAPVINHEKFEGLSGLNVQGSAIINPEGKLAVSVNDVVTQNFSVGVNSLFKYSVRLECREAKSQFVAQIYWDTPTSGASYYKLLNCEDTKAIDFSEVGLIPQGATEGVLYLSVRTGSVFVTGVAVGLR
jgi:hypothetical protein